MHDQGFFCVRTPPPCLVFEQLHHHLFKFWKACFPEPGERYGAGFLPSVKEPPHENERPKDQDNRPRITTKIYGWPYASGTIHSEMNEMLHKGTLDSAGGAPFFQFPGLCGQRGLNHWIFTRHGGVSFPPYDSLNVSTNTDDNPHFIRKNFGIITKTIGTGRLHYLNQVHGGHMIVLRGDQSVGPEEVMEADALMTDIPELALMIKVADCQAVILYDPLKKAVSNVHCGWRGNVSNILGAVVKRMAWEFGSESVNLKAAVGPSLGPCCAEFITYREIFPENFRHFMLKENYFDLWAVSRWQLLEGGLKEENIEISGLCTRCRSDLFFSHRGEKVTGRFATVAMLK
jgi:YfiH family protein